MGERFALVMAGGIGTRLWPASTRARPKQLIPALPAEGQTLLSATIERVSALIETERIYVMTTQAQLVGVREALPELPAENVLAEPCGRNTGPCVGLGLTWMGATLGSDFDDAVVVALPADHYVADTAAFRAHLDVACSQAAEADTIALLGIEPDRPDTNYGYIARGEEPLAATDSIEVFGVERFVEKPAHEKAEEYLASGRYLWNAGIFAMPVGRVRREFAQHCAVTWAVLERIGPLLANDDSDGAAARAYAGVEARPFDIAIMEKQTDARVVPFPGVWSDIGSWQAIRGLLPRDEGGNCVVTGEGGKTEVLASADCVVWNEDGTVGVVGVSNVAVVVSRGRVLVCPVDGAEAVREAVESLGDDE